MRDVIAILNLVFASLGAVIAILGVALSRDIGSMLQLGLLVLWVICAIKLWTSPRLWPWFGSLIAVSIITLQLGAGALRFLGLFWQAGYGDRSIMLDPTTIGAPLAGSVLMTVGAVFLLLLLLTLPAWRGKKAGNA